MAVSAKDVMSLRKRTGLGMMDCKKAMAETDGDIDKAMELLRKNMKGKMDDRSDRVSSEGAVAMARGDGCIALVAITSETDFVARNEKFIEGIEKIAHLALEGPDGPVEASKPIDKIIDDLRIATQENVTYKSGARLSGDALGSYVHHNRKLGVIVQGRGDLSDDLLTGICQHITAAVPTPLAVDEAALPAEDREKQKSAAVAEAEASGKPPQIAEKIATGKLRKWIDENTLLGQIYLRELDARKPVRDYLPKDGMIERFVKFSLSG
jgi:elongation factor Ts